MKIGDTVRIRLQPQFKINRSLFDGIIGWDTRGPIFALPTNDVLFTLETPKDVEEYNQTGTIERIRSSRSV